MNTIYTSGKYLEVTQTWHSEDSQWKADQIEIIARKNKLTPSRIVEIGCGAGGIIHNLSQKEYFNGTVFSGYDISPQAIQMAQKNSRENVRFLNENLFSRDNIEIFDLILAIDVVEHVQDYMGFLENCRNKAQYKIYHIPLDIHVSSVIRNSFLKERYSVGHLHYFTAESALEILKDTGHEILDYYYTSPTISLFKQHPSPRRAFANIARWAIGRISIPIASRLLGGYSLLVLAK